MAFVFQVPDGLPRDANATPLQATYNTMQSGSGTVTTAGTPVQLAASYSQAKRIDISNPTSNSGAIYVGGTAVSATKGVPLQPAFTYTFFVTDLSKVWVDADVNGSTFQYTYYY